MKKPLLKTFIAVTIAAAASGCSSNKPTMTYFDDIIESPAGTLGNTDYQLKIVPDDQLTISVNSTTPSATMIFNMPPTIGTYMGATAATTTYQTASTSATYLVSAAGDINFPVFGHIHVAGMSTEELEKYLEQRIAEVADGPIVTVKLDNFQVNILGEVNRPGTVAASSERFSVLDAIAKAGDLTAYAVRDNVLLIRETNGQKEYVRLNLQDSKLFESPYFYLKQNDIIVVDPNDVREANSRYNTNNAYRIQVTSAVISACSVVASLVIALAIK